MSYVPLRKAVDRLGLHPNTLRKYADEGFIHTIRNEAGQRLFDVDGYIRDKASLVTVCYCRVSSYKQKEDLTRQVEWMQAQYPEAEIVKDIGSGLNYKRKGLRSLLERSCDGAKLRVVVAHKDRLARFGFELIEWIITRHGGEILVLNQSAYSPERELTEDLLSIVHVFSCRLYGKRKYGTKDIANQGIPNLDTATAIEALVRSIQVGIQ